MCARSPLVTGIELQDSLLVCVAEETMGEAVDAGGLTNTGQALRDGKEERVSGRRGRLLRRHESSLR